MNRISLLFVAILGFVSLSRAGNRFVESGVPSPSHEWYGRDYTRAAGLFVAGTVELPRYDGSDGEKIFVRMTNSENFSFARNSTLPLAQRMEDFLAMQEGANSILKRYVAEANRGAKLNREMAQQLAYSLRMCTVMCDLVDEFMPTVKKDEKYAVRMDGLRKMKMSLETVFSGAEESLGEKTFYTDSDLTTILAAMAETLPRLRQVLSEDFHSELQIRLKQRAKEFKSPEALRLIEAMEKDLAE